MQGVEPEARTFNTIIIACNLCGQPLQALEVRSSHCFNSSYKSHAVQLHSMASYSPAKQGSLQQRMQRCAAALDCCYKALHRWWNDT